MKYFLGSLCCLIFFCSAYSQLAFVEKQKSFPKVKIAFNTKQALLEKRFLQTGLSWPPKEIYIRSFKYDSELEVWGRNNRNDSFKLVKTYKICALSGTMGPKRMDGDFQVPEGFYYVNEFRPNSSFHLALGINYPNSSDQLLSDSIKPGSDILIHGSCVTQGCIPIQNDPMEELYLLATYAYAAGQDFIPVHIFPIRFSKEKSVEFLKRSSKDEIEYQKMVAKMQLVSNYFEQNKKLPVIAINVKGEYQIY